MVDSKCEILWADNSGAYLGRHPKENYSEGLDGTDKQAIIAKQRLISKMLWIWINKPMNTDANWKLSDFISAYNFNTQDDGATMFCVIIKSLQPDTNAVCSDIKSNMENMNMSHFKHDIPKINLKIAEWMNEISISR